MNHIKTIAQELGLNEKAVEAAVNLIDEGNTIPFIARYRKEATGSMDDQVLRKLGERLDYLRGLEKRRDEVKRSIEEQGALTEELAQKLEAAETLARLEDLYRPYRPKRKTRASVARARGLASLAELLLAQNSGTDPEKAAAEYLSEEVPDTAAALGESFCLRPVPPPPWPVPGTFWRSSSATMPPCARSCGNCISAPPCWPAKRPMQKRNPSTSSTTTMPNR